jgi:hypothetical protein
MALPPGMDADVRLDYNGNGNIRQLSGVRIAKLVQGWRRSGVAENGSL